jgi:hypothetical protein
MRRSGLAIPQPREAQSYLGDRSDAGRKGVRPVGALLAARSQLNTRTGLTSPRTHGRGPSRDDSLFTAKTFEHIGYGRACTRQVAGEHSRPLPAQLLEQVDRLSPGR